LQSQRWSRVERKVSVRADGIYTLDPSIDRANGRTGKWTAAEDSKLKDAVLTHGGKDWIAIAVLVPGRTKIQCNNRWKVVDPSIDWANERTGRWTAVEDSKLKDSIQTHGDKDWVAISVLVPGRTRIQCWSRWRDVPSRTKKQC
jgi:myb proto-oncogene protein